MFYEVFGFSAFALAASATPGPNNLLLTGLGASVGLRRGLPVLFGIAFGFAIMILIVSLGFGPLVNSADSILIVAMRLVGILIITWMAWQIATSSVPDGDALTDAPQNNLRVTGFFGAAMFQWVNPKAWLICASAIAAYIDATSQILPQALVLAFTFIVTSIIGCLPWLAAGALVGRYLTGLRARIFNAVMALLLIVSMLPALI